MSVGANEAFWAFATILTVALVLRCLLWPPQG
jgi:hypothetical protein